MAVEDPTEREPRRGRSTAALEVASNVASVLGTALTAAAAIKGHNTTLKVVAAIALAVAVVIGFVYVIRTRRRSIRIPQWTAFAVVLVVLCSVGFALWTAISVPRDGGKDADPTTGPTISTGPPTVSTGPPTSSRSAGCGPLTTAATIEAGRDDASSQVTLASASYTLVAKPQIQLQLAGRVQGTAEKGSDLYLVGTADTSTVDSTPEEHRGAPDYYLQGKVTPDSKGCWSLPRRAVSYECSGGVTFIYSLVSVAAAQGQALMNRQLHERAVIDNGFSPREFEALPLKMLQQFRVDTTAARCK